MTASTRNPDSSAVASSLLELMKELYPICRSITGVGVRKSLEILRRRIPLEVREVASGARVFDWTVPAEWNITDAWIKNAAGERVVDFQESNLHVVSYSVPVGPTRMKREELAGHLHTLPDHPEWIPYRTSYYKETWGFCLSQRQLEGLVEDEYEVCIDSRLEPGHLTYGELVLPGATSDEVLFSSHICHPSLCNDNLSGVSLATALAERLSGMDRRYTYRFLFIPGTIGAITWLARNAEAAKRIRHGLTLVCLGDSSSLKYKKTLRGDAEIDRAARAVLEASGEAYELIDFYPYGYDERQYNSPGFRLPVGSLMRGRHGTFSEYHTSADNLEFVTAERLAGSFDALCGIVDVLEGNRRYRNLAPHCEPQLGKRGIYREMGDADQDFQLAMLWVLNLSDGEHGLLDIVARSGIGFPVVRSVAELLERCELLEEIIE